MSPIFDQLKSIIKIPYATYPIKTSVNNTSIRYENEMGVFYIVSLSKSSDKNGGQIIMQTSDNDAWPLPDDESLLKKIIARMESNSSLLGKRYKPTINLNAKKLYLSHNDNAEWYRIYREEEDALDNEHPIFCICGKLATGLHTASCRKWRDTIVKRTVKRLNHLLPTLEAITLPLT